MSQSAPDAIAATTDAIKAIDSLFRTDHELSIEAIEQLAAAREGLREALHAPPSLLKTYEELPRSERCSVCGGSNGPLAGDHSLGCLVLDFRDRLRNADDVLRRLSVKSVSAYIEKWWRDGSADLPERNWTSLAQQIVLALEGEDKDGA